VSIASMSTSRSTRHQATEHAPMTARGRASNHLRSGNASPNHAVKKPSLAAAWIAWAYQIMSSQQDTEIENMIAKVKKMANRVPEPLGEDGHEK